MQLPEPDVIRRQAAALGQGAARHVILVNPPGGATVPSVPSSLRGCVRQAYRNRTALERAVERSRPSFSVHTVPVHPDLSVSGASCTCISAGCTPEEAAAVRCELGARKSFCLFQIACKSQTFPKRAWTALRRRLTALATMAEAVPVGNCGGSFALCQSGTV